MPSPPPAASVVSSPVLAGERVSFTGTLASMTHKEAHARVVENGGTAAEHVSRQSTMLVIGEEGWPLEADGKPSVKLQQAEKFHAEGLDIRIVKESEWLGFVGLDGWRDELHRRCTPAMLSQMLHVSVHEIRRWERMGLIKAVAHVCRLPYFDFQEVAGARRLAELVAAGVPIHEIQSSLVKLQSVVGVGERPLAQLEILAGGKHVLYRDGAGRLKTAAGQRMFDFAGPPSSVRPETESLMLPVEPLPDRSHWKSSDWFEEGRRLADDGQLAPAVEMLRMSLMDEPDAPEVHFYLAEVFYRLGNVAAALERYYVAVEQDHNYLEAWTQIGCLLAELREFTSAIDAFDIALDIHGDYPDAHLHKAETLLQAGRGEESVVHWRAYLKFDRSGPWADAARKRLEEVEK
ncbi:MAG TPA: tetratricopeptide repeat protein [Planctomycetaceae bacterium]